MKRTIHTSHKPCPTTLDAAALHSLVLQRFSVARHHCDRCPARERCGLHRLPDLERAQFSARR